MGVLNLYDKIKGSTCESHGSQTSERETESNRKLELKENMQTLRNGLKSFCDYLEMQN
jgi:hypothetical protein